jgi:hypothetical protein
MLLFGALGQQIREGGMPDSAKRDRVAETLYHLGKGIWRSIPVLGPIVDEVVYKQFEAELKGQVEGEAGKLSDEELDAILSRLPTLENLKQVDERMGQLSEQERLLAMENHAGVLEHMSLVRQELQTGFASVTELIDDLRNEFSQSKDLQRMLEVIDGTRKAWVSRISENQRKFLSAIPRSYTPLDSLWEVAKGIIPECGYKEFRFRLHELEWLGLVERKSDKQSWLYRRAGNGPG